MKPWLRWAVAGDEPALYELAMTYYGPRNEPFQTRPAGTRWLIAGLGETDGPPKACISLYDVGGGQRYILDFYGTDKRCLAALASAIKGEAREQGVTLLGVVAPNNAAMLAFMRGRMRKIGIMFALEPR